ncbi:MAG: nucleotidyltransferase domain-containing protein [Candidatus Thorarchaeota archaeon]
MEDQQVRKQYEDAASSFIERAKLDRRVLAIIMYGSLAYDEVTERSNINMVVIIDQGRFRTARLVEHGVPIDVEVYSRDDFMRRLESARGRGMLQVLSFGKLVFSRDCSFTEFYKGMTWNVGMRDREHLQILYHLATLYDLSKAEKYLYIKKDISHSFHFLIHALSELGYLLCYINDVYPPREVILRGREFEPELYSQVYDDLISNSLTEESMDQILRKMYEFMDSLDLRIYKPVLDFISEQGGTVSQTDLMVRLGQGGFPFLLDLTHLHRRRILRRTVTPVKLTKKGIVEYNEAQYHFSWDSFDESKIMPTMVGPAPVDRELVLADYENAVDAFLNRAKSDEYVLTVALGGSLSYDKVWEKSDIDIILVTKDEPYRTYRSFIEKDVSFDVFVLPRDTFRKLANRRLDGSVFNSYVSKSKILFTRDDTIYDIIEDANETGERDLENLLFLNYVFAKDLINKAYKAMRTKEDHRFAVVFMMPGIRRLANIEVLLNRMIPLRESTAQALELNPGFFNRTFTELVEGSRSREELEDILQTMEQYLMEHLNTFVKPIQRLLAKKEEITHSDLMTHFNDIRLPIDLRDFVEMGLITQTHAPLRFTKVSSSEMMQPAYQMARGYGNLKSDYEEVMPDFLV